MGGDATEVVAPAAGPAVRRGLPKWMTGPGAMPKPDFKAFKSKMAELAEKKRSLIAQVKGLRASIGPKGDNGKERDELFQRIKSIEEMRKAEQEMRSKKSSELNEAKKKHNENARKLRELTEELAGFKSVEEIDRAIVYMTRKMESSGGGLAAEKRMLQQLAQLEGAKRYLQELQPLSEAVDEAKHHEATLLRELQEINERIRDLNSKYKDQRSVKMQKDEEIRSAGANRQEVFKKCDEINANIAKIAQEMNSLSEAHQKAMEKWNAWCDEARAKHIAKMEEIQKDRQRRIMERKNAAKLEEKRARALRRMNPYEVELAACDTLLRYLGEQKIMVQRENEERAKREAAAAFDPTKFAPEGAVLLNDGKGAGEGKSQKSQHTKKVNGTESAAKSGVIKHSDEKVKLFKLVSEEPPQSVGDIDGVMESLRTKQQEYASHIKTGEPELSSDDEEEQEQEQEQEQQENEGAAEEEGDTN